MELTAGDYGLRLDPARGGSIAALTWCGQPLLRETCGPSVLDTACFPLVPFSNRIAHGRFAFAGADVRLAPNMPGADHPHPLHGHGWLAQWQVIGHGPAQAVLRHNHSAGGWPWRYVAEQHFALSPTGLRVGLRLRNQGPEAMPAGLGFHPYFPRNAQTLYLGRHRGEWHTGTDGLPLHHSDAGAAIDWWQGQPVAARCVDTVYTGRVGALRLAWPERRLTLAVTPSANLPCTVVYTPAGADYLCVEPVSHATNVINRADAQHPMRVLAPGREMRASMWLRAGALG